MKQKHTIAAYYFPQYHVDPLNEMWHGKGWDEWEMVRNAKPRFPGHQQPKQPLWGHYDESDPAHAKLQIETAHKYGVDAFIYDWYWYEDQPFLHGALEKGFMKADNNELLEFSLMWANHDWMNYYPVRRGKHVPTLTPGTVSMESFERMTDYIIDTYFRHPSYWKLDGKPYFSIFETSNLVKGLGGLVETRVAMDRFREKTKAAGFPDLHINCVIHGIYPFVKDTPDFNAIFKMLGFDSTTPYNWGFHMKDYPAADYAAFAQESMKSFQYETDRLDIPYFPNVTLGWDVSPRTDQDDIHEFLGYPYTATLVNNTPEEIEKVFVQAKEFLDQGLTNPSILIINAWNEWTEGCYLEPDEIYGFRYLEALKRVFK